MTEHQCSFTEPDKTQPEHHTPEFPDGSLHKSSRDDDKFRYDKRCARCKSVKREWEELSNAK